MPDITNIAEKTMRAMRNTVDILFSFIQPRGLGN
jgi:hypothetical protein